MTTVIIDDGSILGARLAASRIARGGRVVALRAPDDSTAAASSTSMPAEVPSIVWRGDAGSDLLGRLRDGHETELYNLVALQRLRGRQAHGATPERTTDAVRLAEVLGARLHHVTTTLGDPGLLAEEDEIVRRCRVRWRVYRTDCVVGCSDTGEMDADDPLALTFGFLRALSDVVPRWMSLPRPTLGRIALIPADSLATQLDELAERVDLDRRSVHVAGSEVDVVDLLNELTDRVRGPRISTETDAAWLAGLVNGPLAASLRWWPRPAQLARQILEELGFAPAVATAVTTPDAPQEVAHTDVTVTGAPTVRAYSRRLWGHWSEHLDPEVHGPELADILAGRIVLVTGASSGIGRALSRQLAAAGAHVLLAARRADELEAVTTEIRAAGGKADWYSLDLASAEAVTDAVEQILAAHGAVDVLVNNAGFSILRPIADQLDRLRDFERTMAVNYLGPTALALGVLPSMLARGDGHIVNVLSAAAQTPTIGFAAYGAAKAAMDYLGQCLDAELGSHGIAVSNIYMGLVATPMLESPEAFADMGMLTPEEAADVIAQALISRTSSATVMPLARLDILFRTLFPEASRTLRRAFSHLASWQPR